MKKETKEKDNLGDLIKPNNNRVCIELIVESDSYFGEFKKLDSKREVEPYAIVLSVGPNVTNMKPGDYVLTRHGMQMFSFKVYNRDLTIVYDSDLECVLDPIIIEQIKKEKTKEINTAKIEVIKEVVN